MTDKNKCCDNPEGGIIPIGKDGYLCRRCYEETHKEVLIQIEELSK